MTANESVAQDPALVELGPLLAIPAEPGITDDERRSLLGLVAERTGVCLRPRRAAMLAKQVAERVRVVELGDFGRYYKRLVDDVAELEHVLTAALNTASYFLRNERLWRQVGRVILPDCARIAAKAGRSRVRCWSAATSNGAEAYTLGILWLENVAGSAEVGIEIIGTDICSAALRRAAAAEYFDHTLVKLGPTLRERYFVGDGSAACLRVRDSIRTLVRFAEHDVRLPFQYNAFDLVLLRNILCHLEPVSQRRALEVAASAVAPAGFLVLGDVDPPGFGSDICRVGAFERVAALTYRKLP